jgi:hypothetical protein
MPGLNGGSFIHQTGFIQFLGEEHQPTAGRSIAWLGCYGIPKILTLFLRVIGRRREPDPQPGIGTLDLDCLIRILYG